LGPALEKENAWSEGGVADDDVPVGISGDKTEDEGNDDEADGELDLIVVEVPPVRAVKGEEGGVWFEKAIEAEDVLE